MSEIVVVLTTVPDHTAGERIARALVDERLAACVNVHGPMVSCYRWQGAVEVSDERQLTIKTTVARVHAVRARIAALHTYDLPEFIVIPVDGSDSYSRWIVESVADEGPTRSR
jgi:periplasmic divalent cation tolerance protein